MNPDEKDEFNDDFEDDYFPHPFNSFHDFEMMHGHLEVEVPQFKNSITEEREYTVDEIRELVIDNIRQVYDPEISTNVYDLGLIYEINFKDINSVDIKMTLTSPNCPSAQELPAVVQMAALAIDKISMASVEIVWDPPWGPEKLSDEAKLELGWL
jgi:FeS assembly SUF system protein